ARTMSLSSVPAHAPTDGLGGGRPKSRLFEIPIDLGRPEELLRMVTDWVGSGRPRRVMYVNAHVLNQSQERPELRAALQEADLVYCDGYGVRIAAKALELPTPHRMTGADWVWTLAALCQESEKSIYLLGSEPGIAREAAQRLTRWYPRLRIAGSHHGFFAMGSPHAERVVEDINARRPDILLVGMGTPKQEHWVQEHVHRLDVDVFWTVGALFDYVSGRIPRAPGWLADNGLEWIFRLGVEPQRMWRRYLLGNPVFLSRVMAEARDRRAA
ncbi:MAG: WecB/TagA/CpsF family glycosyltransferase, partial [Solirubrobacteraceae bacterium]